MNKRAKMNEWTNERMNESCNRLTKNHILGDSSIQFKMVSNISLYESQFIATDNIIHRDQKKNALFIDNN
jgi:hypothetical protein